MAILRQYQLGKCRQAGDPSGQPPNDGLPWGKFLFQSSVQVVLRRYLPDYAALITSLGVATDARSPSECSRAVQLAAGIEDDITNRICPVGASAELMKKHVTPSAVSVWSEFKHGSASVPSTSIPRIAICRAVKVTSGIKGETCKGTSAAICAEGKRIECLLGPARAGRAQLIHCSPSLSEIPTGSTKEISGSIQNDAGIRCDCLELIQRILGPA